MSEDAKRLFGVFIALCVACAAALAILIFGMVSHAQAHSWYSRTNCCSGNDCNEVPLDASWVIMEEHGYRVTMTLEQAKTINPKATVAIDVFIPYTNGRIKVPPPLLPGETYGSAAYHLCIPPSYNGVYCLFVVPGT